MKPALYLLATMPLSAQSCLLQGTAVSALTGEPIEGVKIFAHDISSASAYLRRSDSQGRFCFEHLAPGTYHLIAQRAGFLDQLYGGSPGGSEGLDLTITADSKLPFAKIKLTARPILAGTVLHPDGYPAAGVEVMVSKRVHTHDGPDQDNVESAQTDDRGMFRFADLPPGTYYVSAQPDSNIPVRFSIEFLDSRGQHPSEEESVTYFPSASSFAGARPVVLKAGQEVSGLAITLRTTPLRRISGRVNSETYSIYLDPQTDGLRGVSIPVKADGSFESYGLLPGKYNLQVRAHAVIAEQEVDLTAGDINGLTIEQRETFTVPLVLKTEGNASLVRPGQFRIILSSVRSGGDYLARATAGGDAEFASVLPGTYRLSVLMGSEPYYLKSVAMNGKAQSPGQLDLLSPPNGALELTFSPHVATIQGRTNEKPDGAVTVVLVQPGAHAGDDAGYEQRASTDQDGAFHLDRIKPGKYRLFAIEGFDEGPWGNPELAASLHSVEVELGESEMLRVTVPLVKAQEWDAAVIRFGQ